jgi:alkaline phosphatase D
MFAWGDAQFFMLDDRYFRSPNYRDTGEQTMIGEHQVQWLIDALSSSQAQFKFVVLGNQFLNPVKKYETYSNLYPQERLAILDKLKAEGIEGVIFLTGDRHHSELSKLAREDSYPLYEWTVSPLTAQAYDASDEQNRLRVDGSHYGKRNYGTMRFSGPSDDRRLTLRIYSVEGEKVWEHEIKASELR